MRLEDFDGLSVLLPAGRLWLAKCLVDLVLVREGVEADSRCQ